MKGYRQGIQRTRPWSGVDLEYASWNRRRYWVTVDKMDGLNKDRNTRDWDVRKTLKKKTRRWIKEWRVKQRREDGGDKGRDDSVIGPRLQACFTDLFYFNLGQGCMGSILTQNYPTSKALSMFLLNFSFLKSFDLLLLRFSLTCT